jgi:hypothetical protein
MGCCGFKPLPAFTDFLESFLTSTLRSFLDRYRALKNIRFFLFHSLHFFLCRSFWQPAPHVFWCPLLLGLGVYHRPHTRQGRLIILHDNYIIPPFCRLYGRKNDCNAKEASKTDKGVGLISLLILCREERSGRVRFPGTSELTPAGAKSNIT